jgi:hypothetical protein
VRCCCNVQQRNAAGSSCKVASHSEASLPSKMQHTSS